VTLKGTDNESNPITPSTAAGVPFERGEPKAELKTNEWPSIHVKPELFKDIQHLKVDREDARLGDVIEFLYQYWKEHAEAKP